MIDCLGMSLWQHAACCFVVIFLVCLGTQSCWHISFRLAVLKRKILLCCLRSEFSFLPFPFLLSGKCTSLSRFSHSFVVVENALKCMLIQLFALLKCWKYLPKVGLFLFSFFLTVQLGHCCWEVQYLAFWSFFPAACPVYYSTAQVVRLPASFSHPVAVQQRRNHLCFHRLHNTLRR